MNKKYLIPVIALLSAVVLISPVMGAKAANKVTGGGWIIDQYGNRANFGMNAHDHVTYYKGQVQYNCIYAPTGLPIEMHSTSITAFTVIIPGIDIMITGTCTVDYAGVSYPCIFEMYLWDGDNSALFPDDYVWMRLFYTTWFYDSFWQILGGGKIQVH